MLSGELWPLRLTRRRFRVRSASLRSLSLLPHYPILIIGRPAPLLGGSWPQAVVQRVERTGYRRNRLLSAHEALTVLNRPFGEEPLLPGTEDDWMR